MSDSSWPHEPQNARAPCPSLMPRVYSNSCPLSWWCHPTISSSVVPFSSRLQSFPASGSFQWVSSLYQVTISIGASASALVLPMNIQDSFPLGWLVGSPSCPRDSQESSPTPQFKSISSLVLSFLYSPLSHAYMTTGKTIALTRQAFVGKVMTLLFNMLSRFVITFLPRSKHLLILWPHSPSIMILEPNKIKSVIVSTISTSICHEVMGWDAVILVFLNVEF